MAILEVSGVTKRFYGLVATDNLNLAVEAGEIHAVIGPNGAGKTTLINLLTGELHCDEGRIVFAGEDITTQTVHSRVRRGLGRSYQISQLFRDMSVLQNMLIAAQGRRAHCFSFWTPAAGDLELVGEARRVLEQVGLLQKISMPVAALAHGEMRQLELAMTLVTKPKLLLLDEPMAGMGAVESERIIGFLGTLKGQYSILLVEHDMDAVFALADRITVLVNGTAIACGSIMDIRADEAVRGAYLGDEEIST